MCIYFVACITGNTNIHLIIGKYTWSIGILRIHVYFTGSTYKHLHITGKSTWCNEVFPVHLYVTGNIYIHLYITEKSTWCNGVFPAPSPNPALAPAVATDQEEMIH